MAVLLPIGRSRGRESAIATAWAAVMAVTKWSIALRPDRHRHVAFDLEQTPRHQRRFGGAAWSRRRVVVRKVGWEAGGLSFASLHWRIWGARDAASNQRRQSGGA